VSSFAWEHEFIPFLEMAKEDELGMNVTLSSGNVASRVLPIKIHDLDADDQASLEAVLDGTLRSIDFIYQEPGVNRPLTPLDERELNLSKKVYRDQINKTANAIKGILIGVLNPVEAERISLDEPNILSEKNQKSIVVLPFVNMSSMKVISRTSSNHYKNTTKLLREIANELDVDFVLEGSVRRQNKDLRITAQLIEATNDNHLWADNYQGKVDDVFEIQEQVAGEIVEALDLQLTSLEGNQLSKRQTDNVEAFDLFLKGTFAMWQFSAGSYEIAIKYFEHAIEIDPGFGKAYAGIGMCYNGAAWFENMNRDEALIKANEWLEKAIHVDDQIAEAYNYLAYNNILNWKWAEAEKQIRKAIELKPSYADAHLYYGWLLGALAKFEESELEFQRAIKFDPQSVIIKTNLAFPYYWKKDFARSIEQVKSAIKMEPTFNIPYFFLGISYVQAGHYEESIKAFQTAIKFSGGLPYYKAWLAHAYALSGNKNEAVKILSELEQISAEKGTLTYQLALVHLGLGNNEKALNYLEKAFNERGPYMIYLKVEPYLDPLRSHPRFIHLIKRMNLL
jgi:TolB-like protein/Flp pilus assembly protein TadD